MFVHLLVLTRKNQPERYVALVCGNGFGLADSMFMYSTATAIAEPTCHRGRKPSIQITNSLVESMGLKRIPTRLENGVVESQPFIVRIIDLIDNINNNR